MPITPGMVLQNRYRVVALLGEGGMGTVYRAWDTRLSVPVALKEMRPDPRLDADQLSAIREQFQEEAVVLSQLSHPSLVRVSDFFDEGDATYLVMALVDGESIAHHVQRTGAQPEAQVLIWADQLLDALAHCHAQGVIHRDIKPQNVILRRDGNVVLVDFGLAKRWDPAAPRTRTAIRSMGTPSYAPLEQYDPGLGHTDPRSDIYSLGATLYYALTAQEPPTAAMRAANPGSLVPVRQIRPEVTPETERAIEQAMALQPDGRFPSATAMRATLAGTADQQRDRVPRPSEEGEGASRPRRTFPLGIGGMIIVAAVACVLTGAAAVGVWQWLSGGGGPTAEVPATVETGPSPTPGVVLKKLTVSPEPSSVPSDGPTPDETPSPAAIETPTPDASATAQAVTIASATVPPSPTATPTHSPPIEAHALGDLQMREPDGMRMIYVPTGSFTMGSSEEKIRTTMNLCSRYGTSCERETFTDEEPPHGVSLQGFWLDQTEVTNQQYSRCVAAGACNPPAQSGSYARGSYYGNPAYKDYPVIYVNWYQARTYCEWAGGRLPTEAEWEYAAAGPQGRLFPWGDTFDGHLLNYCDAQCDFDWRDSSIDDGYKDTSPVGHYSGDASWCGAHDLAGNVWEWVADRYLYYETDEEVATGSRVLRGGTWHLGPDSARAANRDHFEPGMTHVSIGFRCAADNSGD